MYNVFNKKIHCLISNFKTVNFEKIHQIEEEAVVVIHVDSFKKLREESYKQPKSHRFFLEETNIHKLKNGIYGCLNGGRITVVVTTVIDKNKICIIPKDEYF